MRILIDNSGYGLTNYGDIAMLQVAVQRIADLWPDATIDVITSDVALLKTFCPTAQPQLIPTLNRWHKIRRYADPQFDAISYMVRRAYKEVKRYLPQLEPTSLERSWKGYIEAVTQADFVLASGGGYVNDTFLLHGSGVLDSLNEALNQGKPAAIVSHGFEPIQNPLLREKAQAILPRLNLVGCREKKFGPPTLREFGVPEDKIVVTGDDAVALGYDARPEALGDGIGVNLRVTWYAGVARPMVETVRSVLQDAARKHHAPLVPLPISMRSPADADSIKTLLKGYDNTTDGGKHLQNPAAVIQETRRCRLVITGSYHAGVFALSMGVPAVCLGKSGYYIKKFEGLHAQFGAGCYPLALDDPDFRARFARTLDDAWDSADTVRPGLLAAAEEQIQASQDAYQRLYQDVMACVER